MSVKPRSVHAPFVRSESDLYQSEIDLGWAIARTVDDEPTKVGDRILPRCVEVSRESVADEPGVRIVLRVVDGIPTCESVEVSSTKARGVLQIDLLSLNLAEIVSDVFAAFSKKIVAGSDTPGAWWFVADAIPGAEDRRAAKRLILSKRRRKITPELLQEVAKVYRENFDEKPTDAVRRVFGVESRMAAQYVSRARQAGYLGEAQRGRKSL